MNIEEVVIIMEKGKVKRKTRVKREAGAWLGQHVILLFNVKC